MTDRTLTADASENMIKQLQEARADVNHQADLIRVEMRQKAETGDLWSNGQCKAWPAYQAALAYLNEIREAFRV